MRKNTARTQKGKAGRLRTKRRSAPGGGSVDVDIKQQLTVADIENTEGVVDKTLRSARPRRAVCPEKINSFSVQIRKEIIPLFRRIKAAAFKRIPGGMGVEIFFSACFSACENGSADQPKSLKLAASRAVASADSA